MLANIGELKIRGATYGNGATAYLSAARRCMYAQSLRLIVQARRRGFMNFTAAVRQAADMLRPWLRSRKARSFNMLLRLEGTETLIIVTHLWKAELFSPAVGVGAMVESLACGAGMVSFLRRPRILTFVVAFAINQWLPLTPCVTVLIVWLRATPLCSIVLDCLCSH